MSFWVCFSWLIYKICGSWKISLHYLNCILRLSVFSISQSSDLPQKWRRWEFAQPKWLFFFFLSVQLLFQFHVSGKQPFPMKLENRRTMSGPIVPCTHKGLQREESDKSKPHSPSDDPASTTLDIDTEARGGRRRGKRTAIEFVWAAHGMKRLKASVE